MSQFKSGDRVAVYWFGEDAIKGSVESVIHDGKTVVVKTDDKSRGVVHAHPKQCRRLKKSYRRRFWLNVYPWAIGAVCLSREAADNAATEARTECVELVEVRRKEKP